MNSSGSDERSRKRRRRGLALLVAIRPEPGDEGDEVQPRVRRRKRRGGKVEGKKAARRIDRRARGSEVQRFQDGGSPLGMGLSMADPWWSRRASYEMAPAIRGSTSGDSIRVTSPAGAEIPLAPGISPKLGVEALDRALHGYVHGTAPPPPPRGRGVGIPKYPRPEADQNPNLSEDALGLAALAARNRSSAPTDQTVVTPSLLADSGYDPSIASMSGANAATSGFFRRGGGVSRGAGGGLSDEAKLVWRNLPPGPKQTLWARMSPAARRAVQDAERPGHLHAAGVAPSHRRGGRLR